MSEYVRPEYTPLFRETQGIIADYLNSDPQISAKQIEFFPEAKLDIDFEVKKALGQQGIVGVVNTLKGTFAGHDGCTNAWQIEAEVDVIENPPIRRAQLKKMGLSTGTVSDILDWVQESLGGPSSPTFAKFNPVSQEIGQNNGLVVGRSIMRTLVLADTSAVISTENQWVCPYALRQELSALYDEIGELSSEVSGLSVQMGNKADLSSLNNYLPLNLTKPTEISGNAYLDFNCLARFQRPVVMNGALDVKQLNIVNYDVDSYTSLSAIDEDTIGFVGGFNREHTAVLNLKNGTIAYTSDMPSKTSELTNDSGYITSAQVEPSTGYGMNGYAANSDYATKLKAWDTGTALPTDRGNIIPSLNYNSATNTYTLELYGSVGGYYPWILRRLFGIDFSPVITLEWRKGSIYRKRVIGSTVRWSAVYNNNWMWVAQGQYAITCPTGDGKPNGNFYVLNYEDETHPNYINDPATDVHTITYSDFGITSIDGQAGGQTSQTIWCTRVSATPTAIWERPFAYRNELSAKADLSAVELLMTQKQDALSSDQLSSINSVVNERSTIVKYRDNTTQSFYVEGYIDQTNIPNITDAVEVKIGTGVKELGSNLFNGCQYLTKVTIPNTVTRIFEDVFKSCYALTSIDIPDSVSSIDNLFGYTGVTASIVFGSGVTSIPQGMFHYVYPTSVTFRGKTLAQVQAMTDYPWDIEDTSIIKTYNVASQEWVLEQLSALQARITELENQ